MCSRCAFDYDRKARSLAELERRTHADSFWNDPAAAQKTMKEIADLRDEVDAIDAVGKALTDARETLEILGSESGAVEEVDRLIESAGAHSVGFRAFAAAVLTFTNSVNRQIKDSLKGQLHKVPVTNSAKGRAPGSDTTFTLSIDVS